MENNKFYNNKYQIKLDETRGFYHLFPIPEKEELDFYYDKEFYSSNYNKQINDSSEEVQKREQEFFNMQYEDILEIIKKESPGNKVIDIGCGCGNFLEFCRNNNFNAMGLDPSADAVNKALKRNLTVYKSDMENLKSAVKNRYHTAVMLNVLEHIRDPYKILQDIKNDILENNGLLIIKVPNEFNKLQIIANEEYKLNEWWISAPQHINYFTIEHLEKLLIDCGYEIIQKESTFPLEMFILFGENYVGNPAIGKQIHEKRVLFEKTLKKYDNDYKRKIYRAFAEVGLGREIVIYVRT